MLIRHGVKGVNRRRISVIQGTLISTVGALCSAAPRARIITMSPQPHHNRLRTPPALRHPVKLLHDHEYTSEYYSGTVKQAGVCLRE